MQAMEMFHCMTKYVCACTRLSIMWIGFCAYLLNPCICADHVRTICVCICVTRL